MLPIRFAPLKNKTTKTAPPDVRLDQTRTNLPCDLDESIPEVQNDFFDNHLLPPNPLTDQSVADVVLTLLDSGVIDPNTGTWVGWDQPKDTSGKEDTVFAPFSELTELICKASGLSAKRATISVQCNPKSTPLDRKSVV